jgi:SNF2 family DNA or RNA helicase
MSFDYDGFLQPAGGAPVVFDAERRRMITRAADTEAAAIGRLGDVGFAPYPDYYTRTTAWEMPAHQLVPVVRTLTAEGWQVSAEGRLYRPPRRVSMSVSSGIDWFDLTASVEFGDAVIPLGNVLDALRRREVMVRLDDGSMGLLPDDWLKRYGPLAATGEATAEGLRFKPSQAALLDVLLEAQAEHTTIAMDEAFEGARRQLRTFDRVRIAEPPASFRGTLRPYQREGLGWLRFLRQFSFGGCLADDMGLGKTIMVLALLDGIRAERSPEEPRRPSLIVVPRSLVHNWHSEANRFAPELRVLDYSGAARRHLTESFRDVDIVLSTYGTLRRDAEHLRSIEFEYVVLDESQAIKNASTVAAKAVRLLRARHRLALSGTPIENHLGELWSLFDFLNPGLLGASSMFQGAIGAIRPDAETLNVMARGLRPFILRRTKEQVASDLPARTEQTLVCDLEPKQRTFYDSLRAHYQQSVFSRVDRDGLAKSKMHILEALLRLRQAACHPGLVDPKREGDASAKLDVLVPRLLEIAESGHKALVFSQFTSFLALLRRRLDDASLTYEYLDGRVRDRKGRVERFQTDAACPLFLISLKAGGVGLNLTAAGYVFLLDPWWNPAAEAQAIDRTHRIGQTRPVNVYRMVSRDTIEEKVVALQERKRDLFARVVDEGAALSSAMTADDLRELLDG